MSRDKLLQAIDNNFIEMKTLTFLLTFFRNINILF